ncbi:MAG: deoxyribodipyrimidine photo-lyase, partial [Caldimonas sp.]
QDRLQRHHAQLHLAQGEPLTALRTLIRQCGASAVYWNRLYEPAAIERDTRVKQALRDDGIEVHSHNAALWSEPWTIATGAGDPYRVFAPYWRNLRSQLEPTEPLREPSLPGWEKPPGGLTLKDLQLLPDVRWDKGLADSWKPGERGAQELLHRFCDDAITDYARARDLPARHGTSRLSPHLHFGEISPRQIHFELLQQTRGSGSKPDIEPYLRELGWREFAHHLLYHFPQTPTKNFSARFDAFAWAPDDAAALERWRRGRTGFPLVDAGMRELWHTGWMHNRVRMIVASFLTKNLRQHWHHGARWFWDTLVDADLASNTLGWQWVAGCGADAAPYFRVFNPVTQSKKFDPQGEYLARWLPELSELASAQRHEPWKDPGVLDRTRYPPPMVDLGQSRQAALKAYQDLRES